MRSWAIVAALACGCSKNKDGAADAGGDADADTDADSDVDTDADTDTDTDTRTGEPPELVCPDAGCDSDPTGVWNVLGACLDTPEMEGILTRCAGATVQLFGGGSDGTVSFNGTDYNFLVNTGGTTAVQYEIPEECNTSGCSSWETTDPHVTCVTHDGGCECTGSGASAVWLDAGTWTRSGSTLTLHSDSTGGNKSYEICVDGDSLWMFDPGRNVTLSAILQPTTTTN